MNHLAIYNKKKNRDYINMIFDGTKTVDIKLSYKRIAPYNKVTPGDIMYIKESSGPVVGRVKIISAKSYEIEDTLELLDLLLSIQPRVGLRDEAHAREMFEKVQDKKYVTVMELAEPEKLPKGIRIEKFDRRVWIADYKLPIDLALAFGLEPEM